MLVALAAASVLFLLAGCAQGPTVPRPATKPEIFAYNQAMLDATRGNEGLEGVSPRLLTGTALPASPAVWARDVVGCLSDAGFDNVGVVSSFSPVAGGYSLTQSDTITLREKVALYYCVAQHPENPIQSGTLYGADQREYLWTYYTEWQIPCLRLNGYHPTDVPTRSAFVTHPPLTLWTPYDSISFPTSEQTLTDDLDRQRHKLEVLCGPRLGVITSAD
jgi:hypothetical protein